MNQHNQTVPFSEALKVWIRVAALSFGGPAGQIGVMHRILVVEKGWVSERRFLHALNYCMLLPGPEAQQLAIYIGWLLHRVKGGLTAGTLFVLPGFASILALSILYAGFRETAVVTAIFYGLKPAVLAVVAEAVFRIGKRALRNSLTLALAAGAFIGIFFFDIRFPWIIAFAALAGVVGARLGVGALDDALPTGDDASESTGRRERIGPSSRPSLTRSAFVAFVFLALWFGPLLILVPAIGWENVFIDEWLFFSKTAVFTFGGAYAVLSYIAQEAVNTFGWLAPGEMLDGLGMAETTPGPLIQVVQFVAFLGAFRDPGSLDPMTAGILGSIVATWVTFVPCFLWIFLGAPYIEHLRGIRALDAALSAVTAAVVGVILNLAVWFSLHTLFAEVASEEIGPLRLLVPVWGSIDPVAACIAIAAFYALFRLRFGMLRTLGLSALVGAAYHLLAI